MRWSDRQRAMLREMGVRMWERGGTASAVAVSGGDGSGFDNEVELQERPSESIRPGPPSAALPAPSATAAPIEAAAAAAIEWQPADWLVVGEAFDAPARPAASAADEDRLLANMLRAVRVSLDASTRDGRACHFALSASTRPALDRALDGVRPRLILALGRAAAETLLDVDEPLGRLRGQVHQRAGIRVVVSFPLAYLLRNPSEKAKAWADLCLAVRALESDAGASAAP